MRHMTQYCVKRETSHCIASPVVLSAHDAGDLAAVAYPVPLYPVNDGRPEVVLVLDDLGGNSIALKRAAKRPQKSIC